MWDVVVVGGGAAGLLAAGSAAGCGARVLLLEKMRRPGRKLRITGKGRCNVTNVAEVNDFISHFGGNGDWLRPAFEQWFSGDLIAFLEGLGIRLVTERGGRVFPASGRATDVVDTLVRWVDRAGATVYSESIVDSLLVKNGAICGVSVSGQVFKAGRVVLATGGKSYPATGSSGDGYDLAARVGHRIVEVRPALVPLEVKEKFVSGLTGLGLRNIRMKVVADGEYVAEYFGEFCFESYGVTGPVVLSASGGVVDALRAGKKVVLSLDLKPALSEGKLDNRLQRDLDKRAREPMSSVLRGLLPRPLVRPCLRACKIQGHRTGSSVKERERRALVAWMKDVRLTVCGFRPWSEAIVTAGGVDLAEVNSESFESQLVLGLYIVGELLDVQADTGGYNLQAAFSSGWLAGQAAAGNCGP